MERHVPLTAFQRSDRTGFDGGAAIRLNSVCLTGSHGDDNLLTPVWHVPSLLNLPCHPYLHNQLCR